MKFYYLNLTSIGLNVAMMFAILFRMWSYPQFDHIFRALFGGSAMLGAVALVVFAGWGRKFPGANAKMSAVSICVTNAFCLFALVMVVTSGHLF